MAGYFSWGNGYCASELESFAMAYNSSSLHCVAKSNNAQRRLAMAIHSRIISSCDVL